MGRISRSCKQLLNSLDTLRIVFDQGFRVSKCPEIVALVVGPAKMKFSCHAAVLAFHSEFFGACPAPCNNDELRCEIVGIFCTIELLIFLKRCRLLRRMP